MRADTVDATRVSCSQTVSPAPGTPVYRNFNRTLERELENNLPVRLIPAVIRLYSESGMFRLEAGAENGRTAVLDFNAEQARDRDKAAAGLRAAFSKRSGIFSFTLDWLPGEGPLPFLPASGANALRRELALRLETPPLNPDMTAEAPSGRLAPGSIVPPLQRRQLNCANSLSREVYRAAGVEPDTAFELDPSSPVELMRCKYCIRYETGRCPGLNPEEKAVPLYLLNNGRRLKLVFDCARCEMAVCRVSG